MRMTGVLAMVALLCSEGPPIQTPTTSGDSIIYNPETEGLHPIILDTDIGTDVDDAYALVLAATSPELDLRSVTIVNNEVSLRARIAERILYLLTHGAHVSQGARRSLDGTIPPGWRGNEGKGILLRDFASCAWDPADVEIADQVDERGCETIVAVGQLTNVALALRRLPESRRRDLTVYAMASSFNGFGFEAAEREHNSSCDPLALQLVLRSGAFVRLVGLNATRRTRMTRADVRSLRGLGTPLARELAAMHEAWFEVIGRSESPMHDPLTVAAVIRPSLLQFEPMRAEVDLESGLVAFFDDGEPNCEVAVDVDPEGFRELFFSRLLAAVR
ncbi:MAG TPA: nucleoside hydrolase [Fimbriimonadaceae bacterium]|nr:nucleoside hydrolase [Fimbriimonadaceae bacterium]